MIRINNVPFFWKKYYTKGLFWISQLYNSNGLISYQEANELYSMNFVDLYSLHHAIQKAKIIITEENEHSMHLSESIVLKNKVTSYIYHQISPKHVSVIKYVREWEKELSIELDSTEFKSMIKSLYVTTNVPKYRSFQYRLMYRAIVTNVHLAKWKITSTDLCTFCNVHSETYVHLFIECKKVQTLGRTFLKN